MANHFILIDAHGSVVQEGDYSEIAPRINQLEHEALQGSKCAATGRSGERGVSEKLTTPTTTGDIELKRGSDGDFAVYMWYFRVIGWMDFVVFITLSVLFVLGVIYPRTITLTPVLGDGICRLKRMLTVSSNRTLACQMDRERPCESEEHAEYPLRSLLWCRVSGLGGVRLFMLVSFLTHRGSNCNSFPQHASQDAVKVGLNL